MCAKDGVLRISITQSKLPGEKYAAYAAFNRALEATGGGKLNSPKTVVYPNTEEAEELVELIGAGAPEEETFVLGMHLGPLEMVRMALAHRIQDDLGHAAKRLVQLAKVDPQVTLRLATRCFAHKATHILRVQTPEEVRNFTKAFDGLLRQVTDAVVMRGGVTGLTNRQPWQQATPTSYVRAGGDHHHRNSVTGVARSSSTGLAEHGEGPCV